MDGVTYITLFEHDATTLTWRSWFDAIGYIDAMLAACPNIHSCVLFGLVDGKIVDGIRYYDNGDSEVVL